MAYKRLSFLEKARKRNLENKESEDKLSPKDTSENLSFTKDKTVISTNLTKKPDDNLNYKKELGNVPSEGIEYNAKVKSKEAVHKQQVKLDKEVNIDFNTPEVPSYLKHLANAQSKAIDQSYINNKHAAYKVNKKDINQIPDVNIEQTFKEEVVASSNDVKSKEKVEKIVANTDNLEKEKKVLIGSIFENTEDKVVTSNKETNNLSKKKTKKNKIARMILGKPKLEVKNEYKEKVDTVFVSLKQLFSPFKEVLVKTIPFSIYFIKPIEILASFLIYIARFIALYIPDILNIIKGRYFKIFIVLVLILFISGALLSRAINNPDYIHKLELAIYKNTGYKANISGVIKLNFIPKLSIELKKVSFQLNNEKSFEGLQINDLSADSIVFKFKFLPLFLGNFKISDIEINELSVKIKGSPKNSLGENLYQDQIAKIEKIIKTRLSDKIVKQELLHTENEQTLEDEYDKLVQDAEKFIHATEFKSNIDKKILNLNAKDEKTTNEKDKSKYISNFLNIDDTTDSDLENNKGTLLTIFNKFLSRLNFNLNAIESFRFYRSNISIQNNNNQDILSFTNVKTLVTSDVWGKLEIKSEFRLLNKDFKSEMIINSEQNKLNIESQIYLAADASNKIVLKAQSNKGKVTGNLIFDSHNANFIISNYILPIQDKQIKKFTADFMFNQQSLELYNINIISEDQNYTGKFLWNYSKINPDAQLYLDIKMNNISHFTNDVSKSFENNKVKNNIFLSFVELVKVWKKASIDKLKVDNFKVSINIDNTLWNKNKIEKINTSFFITKNNNLYFNNFDLKTSTNQLSFIGQLLLDKNTGTLAIEAKGNLKDLGIILDLPVSSKTLIKSVSKDNENYQLTSKLVLDNTYTIFNELQGYIGKRNFNNTYILINQNTIGNDITIDVPMKNMDFSELEHIYKKQIALAKINDDINNNLFSVPNNISITLKLQSDLFTYKNLKFQNADLEISFIKKGFLIKQISAQGKNGGSFTASFNADTSLSPKIVGNITFTNYFVKLEDIKEIMFSKYNIVGNVIFNGSLKFYGDSYENPIKYLNGNLNFIKQERLKLARFAVEDGIYTTISERKVDKINKFFVNDLYGNIVVKNNQINFYPVFLSYIKDGKVFRGAFTGSYNFSSDKLEIAGSADNEKDTSKKLSFNIKGELLNPVGKSKYYTDKNQDFTVPLKDKDEVLVKKYKVNNKVLEDLNNKDSKAHFNNKYNLQNKTKKSQEIINEDYNNQLSKTDGIKEYKFTPNEKSHLYSSSDTNSIYEHSLKQHDSEENSKFIYKANPKFMENIKPQEKE